MITMSPEQIEARKNRKIDKDGYFSYQFQEDGKSYIAFGGKGPKVNVRKPPIRRYAYRNGKACEITNEPKAKARWPVINCSWL
jgi:hypothetical protein